ncbi:MAG: ABC transporter ATP-binding protein [Thermoplasmataceae archaeon]
MSSPDYSVRISGVTKSYGNVVALNGVDLDIRSGQIFGVLGPNGSGKSTMLKIIASVLQPDDGSVHVLGMDCRTDYLNIRKHIGFVPEDSVIYESLTGEEFLSLVASVYEIGKDEFEMRLEALSAAMDTKGIMSELIGNLSFGNRQKISIIAAMIHDPEILILDEPTKGLDPRSFRIFKNILTMLAEKGKTIIFSTHVMEIAEELCQSLCIIYKGEIKTEGSTSSFLEGENGRQKLEKTFLTITGETDLETVSDNVGRTFQ